MINQTCIAYLLENSHLPKVSVPCRSCR